MGCIIVHMPREENAVRVRNIIKESGYWDDVIICRHGSQILNLVDNQDVQVVICMKKLGDMGYEELVSYLPNRVQVILLTKDAALVPFASNVTPLLMPFRAEVLVEAISKLVSVTRKPKKRKLRSPEEQKIIDQAKQLVMERKAMTESEAFRYLQKISMDSQRSFVETAQMFLELNSE